MSGTTLREIQTEAELRSALDLCYNVLGPIESGFYTPEAWLERFRNGRQPLVFAETDGKVVSAVLGRAENSESLVVGFVACHADYRRRGITKSLLQYFEVLAAQMGFRRITLGSREDAFYEKCGYTVLCRMHDQNIFHKELKFTYRKES